MLFSISFGNALVLSCHALGPAAFTSALAPSSYVAKFFLKSLASFCAVAS
jgi:hypothetical protein